ncbi:hypothetical protein GN157_13295 [Flavobacterium rakeshii]|uniref:Hemerythrin-like domain-containing protein n=1 Tax=Flavobacterium rakeshii TaxID=1038845 RepID=A0A6N8HGA0_9FLAO|nr:hypothetical protein [Flavobacterium rakeshii]MUV04686.1 hypothetical protein [Flavobacterium rakeshii]
MEIFLNEKIKNLVTHDYRIASLLKRYNIDFLSWGGMSLEEVCESKNIAVIKLENKIKEILNTENNEFENFNLWSIEQLTDYIIKIRHSAIKRKIPLVKEQLLKTCKIWGDSHPELNMVHELFISIKTEIVQHMDMTKKIIFPHFIKFSDTYNSNITEASIKLIKENITSTNYEHEKKEQLLLDINYLCHQYYIHQEKPFDINYLYYLLEDFEQDLQMLLHLESNILYPKIYSK